MEPLQPLLVNTSTARHMLGIGRTKLFEMLRENVLVRVKAGRKTLVTISSIQAFAEQGDAS